MSRAQAKKNSKLPGSSFYKYLSNETDPTADQIRKLCKNLKISADELLGIEGDYVSVRILEVKIDGHGKAKLVGTDKVTKEIHFRSDWLFKRDNRDPERVREEIFAFQADHATMKPIEKGDMILVDGKDTREQKGAKFLVLIGASAAIVTLVPRLNSEIRMTSEDGEVEDIPKEDFGARVKVEGKVLWRGGLV
jgi:hypothetical protein